MMSETVTSKQVLVPHVKVWVDSDGEVALSEWRIALLEKVELCGSLAEAARQLDIPYRTAWYKLREMQAALGCVVLVGRSGGASHGGMVLTERAREAIRRYRRVTSGLEELIAERFAREFADF
jgi:molybdate transport system regulatory protein